MDPEPPNAERGRRSAERVADFPVWGSGFRVGLLCLAFVGGGDSIFAQSTNAAFLYSTNVHETQFFWQAVERSNAPVTVLSFGDSMSERHQAIQTHLFNRLQARLGNSGSALGAYWYWGSGAALVGADPLWWTTHGSLPPGGFIYWESFAPVPSDQVGVYWVAHPGGGDFNLFASTNGQPWGDPLLTLDGFAANPVGRHTNLSLPRMNYRLRVDGISGTNSIVGPEYIDRSSRGITVAFMAQAAANLSGIQSLSTNILQPILSALNPQLVVYHMKELGDLGELNFSNRLINLEAMWRACVTNGDVVYLGTPYDYRDQLGEYTGRENTILRAAAVRDHRAYLDCMTPCVSYEAMTNNGYFTYPTGDVHPNAACNQFLTDTIWPQLGFFALRTDRQLAIENAEGAGVLRWNTTTGIVYHVEASSNLASWVTLKSQPGNGLPAAWTNSSGDTVNFFRLRLTQE